MNHRDLERLEQLLSLADRVVPMRDIHKGDNSHKAIGLRHDVDDNRGSLETALRIAEWEFERGYSSTFYLLHDSHYWDDDMLCCAPVFEELGHEVGIHVNAIAEGLRQARNPHEILHDAVEYLRRAVRVVGCVAHGDKLCHTAGFVNDEMFVECRRPSYGAADRLLKHGHVRMRLNPTSLRRYGLEYDANRLRTDSDFYLSDSHNEWSQDITSMIRTFGDGQVHILQHPDWWRDAFLEVAA